jgi:membrane-bound inhibitor of C-type lysozyme/uncharacterized membrane protein
VTSRARSCGLLVTGLLSACVAHGPARVVRDSRPRASAPPSIAKTFAFDCASTEVTVRFDPDDAWVFLPDRTVRLPQVLSGSGARYSDGTVTFWNKGDEAQLQDGDREWHCRVDPRRTPWEDAKLRGVDFRATGTEPRWVLEIERARRIVLVTGDAGRWVETAAPEPTVDRTTGRTQYHVQADVHDLLVVVEPEACRVETDGETFEAAVTVTVDGLTYRGCGQALH